LWAWRGEKGVGGTVADKTGENVSAAFKCVRGGFGHMTRTRINEREKELAEELAEERNQTVSKVVSEAVRSEYEDQRTVDDIFMSVVRQQKIQPSAVDSDVVDSAMEMADEQKKPEEMNESEVEWARTVLEEAREMERKSIERQYYHALGALEAASSLGVGWRDYE
jgi:hypothetical protein